MPQSMPITATRGPSVTSYSPRGVGGPNEHGPWGVALESPNILAAPRGASTGGLEGRYDRRPSTLDGAVVDACLVPVSQARGASVQTVEGLAPKESLGTLQQAFLETGGAQCGICTPGMLMAGEAFLESGASATDENIREAIAGNLCRCTGYTKIIEAIALAAERRTAT